MILLFFLAVFSPFLSDSALDSVPILYQGRIRPFIACRTSADEAPPLMLPIKAEPWEEDAGSWVPLHWLEKTPLNFTPYSESHFNLISEAYQKQDAIRLREALLGAYASIAGKTYKTGKRARLTYPTLAQLATEGFLTRFPLSLIVCGTYALFALISLRKKEFPPLLILVPFTLHTIWLVLRVFVLMRPPVSNMMETLLFVPWATVFIALVLNWRASSRVMLISSASFAALALSLCFLEPGLENVSAVLNSQIWLSIHVLMVVGSYGVFFLSAILAHISLFHKKPPPSMEKAILSTLYIGTLLLVIGTILGGVWAAQSWGRFWDWDPKESWAFISCGTYVIIIHLYNFRQIQLFGLCLGSILGLMSITFTWYGVNYILATGLHSYGFGNGGGIYYLFYLLVEGSFIVFFLYKNWRIEKKEQTR